MKDFSEERKIKIIEKLKNESKVFVNSLVKEFGVSDTTIRRDLDDLSYNKLIVRTHGGAIINKNYNLDLELEIDDRKSIHLEEKKKIAETAVNFVNNGDSILLGGGTTTLELTRLLNKFKNLKVITNSLEASFELSKINNIELIITGGKFSVKSSILTGTSVINYLDNINVDKLFFSTSGVDIKKGLTNPLSIDAEILSKMIEVSTEKYLLADSSKFGQVFFKKIKPIISVNKIITDDKIDSKTVDNIKDLGIDILIC